VHSIDSRDSAALAEWIIECPITKPAKAIVRNQHEEPNNTAVCVLSSAESCDLVPAVRPLIQSFSPGESDFALRKFSMTVTAILLICRSVCGRY